MKTILKQTYGGIDWHDSTTRYNQLHKESEYLFPEKDVLSIIVENICEDFPYVEKEKIEKCIYNKTKLCFPLQKEVNKEYIDIPENKCFVDSNDNEFWDYQCVISFDEESKSYKIEKDYGGQFEYVSLYIVTDVDEKDVAYMVTEEFLNPTKGCSNINRTYHELFTNLQEAKKYFDGFSIHEFEDFNCCVEKMLYAVSLSQMKENEWYQMNVKIIELSKSLNIDICDKSYFSPWGTAHLRNLEEASHETSKNC